MNEEGFAVANLYDWTEDEKTDFLVRHIDEVRGQSFEKYEVDYEILENEESMEIE